MAFARPSPVTPGSKPDPILPSGVLLKAVKVNTVGSNVIEASTSLRLEWRPPLRNNGHNITHYRIERWRLPGKPEVQEVSLLFPEGNPPIGTFTLSFDGYVTDSLSVNISEKRLRDALQSLPSISSVEVIRRDDSYKHVWRVTFWTQESRTLGKNLLVEPLTDFFAGSSSSMKPILLVTKVSAGSAPADHVTLDVPNGNVSNVSPLSLNPTQYTFTGLITGVSYFAQVSSCNVVGCSVPCSSFPLQLAPPKQKPSKPSQVSLTVTSEQSLQVYFSRPECDGGDPVTAYKIEWDTDSSFKTSRGFSTGSHNYIVSTSDEGCKRCSFVISGLIKGVPYFVRVFSYNSLGYSIEYGIPTPASESPKTKASPPTVVQVIPRSGTSLQVSFLASADSGGAFVSKYKVEWDAMGYYLNSNSEEELNSENISPLFASHAVQIITLRSDVNDLSGTFRVAFEGYATDSLNANCTSNEMKFALETLPTVGSIVVHTSRIKTGRTFSITFLTNFGDNTWFGEIPELKVSVNLNDVPYDFHSDTFGINGTLVGTNAAIYVSNVVRAWEGFEQQRVATECSFVRCELGGVFSLSFGGLSTALLPYNVTAEIMKVELEKLETGRLFVTRAKSLLSTTAFSWTIVFLENLGNIPMIAAAYHQLTCFGFGGSCVGMITVAERQVGRLPSLGSFLYGSHEIEVGSQQESFLYNIDGLYMGVEYYVQVSAWNGVGKAYGVPKHSTPAVVCTSEHPTPVTSVALTPLSENALRVSWTPSVHTFSSCSPPKYRLEWTAEPGIAEIQVVTISFKSGKNSVISEFFFLSFRGQETVPITVHASEQTLKAALESITIIDGVAITRSSNASETSWAVTFLNNIGNLPLMEVRTSSNANSFDLYVTELRTGTEPVFNSSSRHFGSTEVSNFPEVQMISISSSANDLNGHFKVHFMGQFSGPIDCGSDADTVKEALEALSTILCVEVSSNNTQQNSYAPTSKSIRSWRITFACQEGNLPSLLVSTGASPPSLIAAGGSLVGSSTIIDVKTIIDGYDPSELTIENLHAQKYYARIFSSFDGLQWGVPSLALFGVIPLACVPSRPTHAVARVVSSSDIQVLWHPPEIDGGEAVTKYSIQWSQDDSFSSNSAIVSVGPSNRPNFYVITDLRPFLSYSIRILAYNSIGYSEPITVVPENMKIVQICLYNETHSANISEKFAILYTRDGLVEKSTELSLHESAATVEIALNAMQHVIHRVSVSRDDHSYYADSSGVYTMPFKVNYRITFFSEPKRVSAGEISVLGEFLTFSANVTLVSNSSSSLFTVKPFPREPSGPRNVILSVVSQTELGVSWDVPIYSSGEVMVKYLVEWDCTHYFRNATFEVTTDTRYQILGLFPNQVYFVRVSAGNVWGYSDAMSAAPLSAKTQRVPLYKPSSVMLSVSPAEIPNRIKIEWGLPSEDSRGFVTDLDECGIHQGHRSDPATQYTIMWDTNPSMSLASVFNAPMMLGDGVRLSCCRNNRCSVEIGTEVQTISVSFSDAGPISSRPFQVVYVGRQCHSAVVMVSNGSNVVEVISLSGRRTIQSGDFIKIYDRVHLVAYYSHPNITLTCPYQGVTSTEVVVFFNTPPATFFDINIANTSVDMQTHIAENFDNSPFDESIVVSRIDLRNGFDYHVTFIGPAFSELTEELFIASNSLGDDVCSSFFKTDNEHSADFSVMVTTKMDSTALSPGSSYFFQIAAVNSAGVGTYSQTTPVSIIPRAPPGLAENCKIYAVPDSPGSFKVTWNSVASNHGSDLLSYDVEFFRRDEEHLILESRLTIKADANVSSYYVTKNGFPGGNFFECWIVAVNSEGSGGPSWYTSVKNLNGELGDAEFLSYKHRSCLCVPTCDHSSEDCFEGSKSLIKSRGRPGAPESISIGGSLSDGIASESRFSKNSVLVSYQPSSFTRQGGELVDHYRIQWGASTDVSLHSVRSHVTNELQYLITDLKMGTEYSVRVSAHNSAGYGQPTDWVIVKPMQSPDPPFSPLITVLPETFSAYDVGTSLEVSWGYPKVDVFNGRSDAVGDGGDPITGYLVEWSTAPWNGA